MAQKKQSILPPEETALFCEQVALALTAGISLYDAMESLKNTYADSPYGARFVQMFDAIRREGTLRAAVQEAGVFPAYLVGMVGVGERTGKLDAVLESLGGYYRWEADVRAAVKSAVLYPVVLIAMLAAVVGILVVSVLPVFERVFQSLGLTADAAGSGSMEAAAAVGNAVLIVVGALLVCGLALVALLRGRRGRTVFEWLCGAIPALGRAEEKLAAGRLASVLATMLAAGWRLDDAMELAPEVIGSRRYLEKVNACARRMREGTPFAEAASGAALFDEMHDRMVRFGAQTGKLDTVMNKVCQIYQQEADAAIDRLVNGIEPLLVAVLSLIIGGVLLAVMLPLLSLLTTLG